MTESETAETQPNDNEEQETEQIGLADCAEMDVITFGDSDTKYVVLSIEDEHPNSGTRWVWRAIVAEHRDNISDDTRPDGLNRELYDTRNAHVIRFTDPGVPKVTVTGNLENETDGEENE